MAGEISLAQAAEIVRAEQERPGAESELLPVARSSDLTEVRDRARELVQQGMPAEELRRRQHRAREWRSWRDRMGMFRFSGALPPETGVPLGRRVELLATRLRRAAREQGGEPEAFPAYAADALVALVASSGVAPGPEPSGAPGPPSPAAGSSSPLPGAAGPPSPPAGSNLPPAGSGSPPEQPSLLPPPAGSSSPPARAGSPPEQPILLPPPAGALAPSLSLDEAALAALLPSLRRGFGVEIVMVCDLLAYRRGRTVGNEVCHIVGGGPIPVEIVRDWIDDAFVKAVLHDGVAIHTVRHFGRHLPAHLRTALDLGPVPGFTGRRCVDCGSTFHLEYDHVDPVANHGATEFANLVPRCFACHRAKTERDRRAGRLGANPPPPPKPKPRRRDTG